MEGGERSRYVELMLFCADSFGREKHAQNMTKGTKMQLMEVASRICRVTLIGVIVVALFMSVIFHAESLAAFVNMPGELVRSDRAPGGGRVFGYDSGAGSPHVEWYPPVRVEDSEYAVPWGTSRLKCFFKEDEAALKVEVKKAWIRYEVVDQDFGRVNPVRARVEGKSVVFADVFSGIDVRYTVEEDCVLEEFVLYELREGFELVQKIAFEGVVPVEIDEGIYFWNGERYLFGIPAPVMYEEGDRNEKCTGLHYELEFRDGVYYLRKVIDEEGVKWLMDAERVYPVIIDATTQSFDDPWENSGLQPYGQYFENLSEYVSPSGQLTVMQTDFYLPGRGMDVEITRVYTVPAVFSIGCRSVCAEGSVTLPDYEDGPYYREYECPPVDVGNGWQLNFPWVGGEYIHFLDGTLYRKGTNHTGHHFTFEDDVLTAASGVEYVFTGGVVTSITDTDGNTIVFGYSGGRLTTITDTVGRVINLSYNSKGQLTQISYGGYTVMYAYSVEALTSVTDPLGRVTSYTYDQRNNWLLTRVSYPTGGYTDYTYSYFSQVVDPPDPLGCFELRKYMVTDQAVYSPDLVNHTCYGYEGDFDGITKTTATVKNEQDFTKAVHEFIIDSNGLTREHSIKDAGGTQLRKVEYTYSDRKEVIKEDVYMGISYVYRQKYLYDSWGNVIYKENGEGERMYCCYAHTDSQKVFRDCNGDIPGFSNRFFDAAVPTNVHTALLGSVTLQDDKVIETYCNHDNGHMVETYQVFQDPADYSVFSGVCDEHGQTSFPVDLTGVQLEGDAVLILTGIPTPNEITKTETHSTYKYCTWFNEGYWQQNTFYAKYIERKPPFNIDYEPIGPFFHYPGTPGFTNYTTWVNGYYQYVKTTYTELEDKYSEQVTYGLNGAPWSVVTSNLQDNTVYYSIPVEELTAGLNTLNFQESSVWVTRCEWALYVPHAVTPLEEVSTAFTYDAYGNITAVTDAGGNTTSFGYDQNHTFVTSITNALNNTVTADYDFSRGFLTSVTDAKGNTTCFEYDILGRVTKKINPDLTEKEAVYDDQNNAITIYDEQDNRMKQYYDGINRLTKTERYISQTGYLTETYTYNYLNRLKTATDPGGHTYSYEYDLLGRIVKQFNPDLTYREVQYNDPTNTVTVFDENQHKKEYCYDWTGQLVEVKEYTDSTNSYVTCYLYDSRGHVTSFTDAQGNTTSYDYDSMFGVTQITYPDATTEAFSYDAAGNILQRSNAHGITAFTYDAVYQLVSISYPDQSSTTFAYDVNGNRTSMIDAAGFTSYTYDNRNRCTSETRTIEGTAYIVAYQYNAGSRIVSVTYPDQTIVTREYDSLNRLVSIPGYAAFTYTADLLESMNYANGVMTEYQYDAHDNPTSIHAAKDTDLFLMNYQYDPVGNITELEYGKLNQGQWEESVEAFGYDWLDRLTSVQGSYLQSYTYDPVGNRLSMNDVTYTYNSMNELLTASDGTVFTYDESGNLLTKEGADILSYTYDVKNRLIEVEKNQKTTAYYTYDGDGKRIQKTEWIESLQKYQTVIYIYSGLNVIYEKNTDTNQEAVYLYGPTGRIAKTADGLTDYYHTDHLGSTRLTTDENGTPLSLVQYKAFGKSTGTEESYLYTGKEIDSTGLYYYGARYYDPETGRFLSRDPHFGQLTTPQTFNRYIYCVNNPLKYRDPDGREYISVLYPSEGTAREQQEVLRFSQSPQLIKYEKIQHDYTWFGYYCIVAGLILGGVGAYFAVPYLISALGPYIVSFAKALAAAGPKVACMILKQLDSIVTWLKGHSYSFWETIKTILAVVALFELVSDIIFDLENIDIDHFTWGFILTLEFDDDTKWGYVYNLSGDSYRWKYEEDNYYVLIDDGWVEMPPGWEPGKPVPPILAL